MRTSSRTIATFFLSLSAYSHTPRPKPTPTLPPSKKKKKKEKTIFFPFFLSLPIHTYQLTYTTFFFFFFPPHPKRFAFRGFDLDHEMQEIWQYVGPTHEAPKFDAYWCLSIFDPRSQTWLTQTTVSNFS